MIHKANREPIINQQIRLKHRFSAVTGALLHVIITPLIIIIIIVVVLSSLAVLIICIKRKSDRGRTTKTKQKHNFPFTIKH